MQYTQLRDLTVSKIGLGCMGMSHLFTGKDQPDEVHIATIHRALDLGVTFFDTAEIYGPLKNEVLVGKALAGHRDEVVIATKFGMMTGEGAERKSGFDSTPKNIRYAVEASLTRLNTDYIDLYYQHRVDKNVPIEDVVGTLSELVTEGKIRHIGLSEAGMTTIRRANAVHPITALQSEYSLWSRDPEDGTLDLLAELGIGFVPYSPLSRGMLGGKIRSLDIFDEDDWRLSNPRFLPGNFEQNLEILQELESIAAELSATPAQVALAWLLAKRPDYVPIPGTVRISHLEEDLAAVDLVLTADQVAQLDRISQPVGHHHNEEQTAMLDRG
ncbi:aryl-alcohol dehydrogenase-like predicted oxidoreductase [Aurantimicrobium minutum]|uniref:aldo/keto reductase n=1 Tax=Aurantimicrobium minutum TaxID=708131 RepID=UPI002476561E|nr:aldo/keto reductase [Aurantimicrobium minutum]MDH6532544.1 aryl-alcohol dehydrogenase-like predicted oxidoreductase [Aurantimicrobium minutum]